MPTLRPLFRNRADGTDVVTDDSVGTLVGFVYRQDTPATEWILLHSNNTTLVDLQVYQNQQLILADEITILGPGQIRLRFSEAITGFANMLAFVNGDGGTIITPTPSVTPTVTPTPAAPTPTASLTPSITPTVTVSPTTGATPTPTSSTTPPASVTPTVTATVTASPVPPTPTPTSTGTPAVTITPTPTSTSAITSTPAASPAVTPTGTPAGTPASTVTPTVTGTAAVTPTTTVTPTITPSPTDPMIPALVTGAEVWYNGSDPASLVSPTQWVNLGSEGALWDMDVVLDGGNNGADFAITTLNGVRAWTSGSRNSALQMPSVGGGPNELTQPYTVFFTFEMQETNQGWQQIWNLSPGGTFRGLGIENASQEYEIRNGGTNDLSGIAPNTNTQTAVIRGNGGTLSLQLVGEAGGASIAYGSSIFGSQFSVGFAFDAGHFKVGELVIVQQALTSLQENEIIDYLAGKWSAPTAGGPTPTPTATAASTPVVTLTPTPTITPSAPLSWTLINSTQDAGSDYWSVAYSSPLDIYVAGRYNVPAGDAVYSTNATTWQAGSGSVQAATAVGRSRTKWFDLAPGYFGMIYENSNVAQYSTDGINWVQDDISPLIGCMAVAHSPDLGLISFLEWNGTGRYATSTGPLNWVTGISGAGGAEWEDMIWVGGSIQKFVAVASNFTTNRIAYSSNGTSWTTVSTSAVQLTSVAYSSSLGLIVAIGTNDAGSIYHLFTSTDAVNWTEIDTSTTGLEDEFDGRINRLIWTGTEFIAVRTGGNDVPSFTSTNGINWTPIDVPNSSIHQHSDVTHNPNNDLLVAVSSNGGNTATASVSYIGTP